MPAQTLDKPIEPLPLSAPDCPLTMAMMEQAADAGYRLEYVSGIGGIWELMPSFLHQKHSYRIQSSIAKSKGADERDCGCVHGSDVSIQFPDKSIKRPDIAIWCEEPQNPAQSTPTLPQAVIEIVSPDYEAKDYAVGAAFYQRWSIADIVIFDPLTNDVLHINAAGETHHASPVTLTFACGCTCTV